MTPRVTFWLPLALALAGAAQADEQPFDAHKTVVEFWQSKGVPQHVAEGIADQTRKESGGNPFELGDGGTSLGLYQHHAERMMAVLAAVENDQAFREVLGEDPIAARHWAEIRSAPDRKTAAKLWQIYFERPAGTHVADPVAVKRPESPPAHPLPAAGSATHDWDVFPDVPEATQSLADAAQPTLIATPGTMTLPEVNVMAAPAVVTVSQDDSAAYAP